MVVGEQNKIIALKIDNQVQVFIFIFVYELRMIEISHIFISELKSSLIRFLEHFILLAR